MTEAAGIVAVIVAGVAGFYVAWTVRGAEIRNIERTHAVTLRAVQHDVSKFAQYDLGTPREAATGSALRTLYSALDHHPAA